MKKIFYYIIATGLLFTACNWLDEDPAMVATNYFETEEGLESLFTGTYSYLTWGAGYEYYFAMTEYGTDLFHQGEDSSYSYFDTYENITSDDSPLSSFWTYSFKGIANANTGIRYSQELGLTDFEGEYKFLRAYYYFTLVQQFGKVPLITSPVTSAQTSYTRASVAEIYAQIIEDLTYAYENLPATVSTYGRATKWAAAHLLAKVYLTRGSAVDDERGQESTDMSNALKYAELVINSGYHSLIDDFTELWDIDNQGNEEIIFAILFGTNTLYQNNANRFHCYYNAWYEDQPGLDRDMTNDIPYRRLRGTEAYAFGDLFDWANDARAIKTFKWAYYANSSSDLPTWEKVYSDDGTLLFDPADIGMTEGEYKFGIGDTALVYSVERTGYDEDSDEMNAYIAQFPYTYRPFERQSIRYFPSPIKHLDTNRATYTDTNGTREWVRMRLGETYLIAAEAAARDGDYSTAAKYLNVIRERASWKDGETKNMHVWKYYGGNNDTESTYSALEVSSSDLSGLDDDELVDYFLDERARELYAEQNRWQDLVRCEKLYERATKYNTYATNIREYHKLRPIPQSHIDALDPQGDIEEEQNEGYY